MSDLPVPQGVSLNIFQNQPKGLKLLFATEAWERFSYYGMRVIMVLFLTAATQNAGFGWSGGRALSIYAIYTGFVYFSPAIGGYLADRWLGYRKATFLGGATMALGHFIMAGPAVIPWAFEQASGLPVEAILIASGLEMGNWSMTPEMSGAIRTALVSTAGAADASAAALSTLEWAYLLKGWSFYLAITLLIIGNGLFKPNMSTIVGELYEPGDQRKDSAYTIFYMGINIGAFFGMLIVGGVGETWGWHYGFSIAGFGMILGLLIFMYYADRLLGEIGKEPRHIYDAVEAVSQKLTSQDVNHIKAICVFAIFSAVFFIGFEQAGGLFNLYAYEYVDRSFFAWEIPASWFGSLNPMFIFIFAPFVAAMWIRRDATGRHVTTPYKFALGLFLMALGFLCMVASALDLQLSADGKSHMIWLVGAYFFHTMGELCISPVGLSMVNQLAPARYAAMAMGFWLFAIGIANWIAGQIGALSETFSEMTIFMGLAVLCVVAAGLLALLNGKMMSWMAPTAASTGTK